MEKKKRDGGNEKMVAHQNGMRRGAQISGADGGKNREKKDPRWKECVYFSVWNSGTAERASWEAEEVVIFVQAHLIEINCTI